MKKLFILPIMFALSACACMNSDEPQEQKVVYKSSATTTVAEDTSNCDYFDAASNTCYKYIRRQRQVNYVAAAPAPVRYAEPARYRNYRTTTVRDCVNCNAPAEYRPTYQSSASSSTVVSSNDNVPCPPQVRETREPVEIVYKKTTYKTVYEPRTTSHVSYEKQPYSERVYQYRTNNDSEYIEVSSNEEMIAEDEIK